MMNMAKMDSHIYTVFIIKVGRFFIIALSHANRFPSDFARSISDQCLTMCHENYPLHLAYVCTVLCKVMGIKIVTKIVQFHVIVSKNSRIKTKQFSVCNKDIICSHCYHKRSKCSPLALTDTVSDATSVLPMHDNVV